MKKYKKRVKALFFLKPAKKQKNHLKKSQIQGIIHVSKESKETVRKNRNKNTSKSKEARLKKSKEKPKKGSLKEGMKENMATREKNMWVLIVFILSGLVIGGLIGRLASNVSGLWWLSFEQEFGLKEPLVLDLSILKLTFALTFKINMASIVGMLISIFIYRKV